MQKEEGHEVEELIFIVFGCFLFILIFVPALYVLSSKGRHYKGPVFRPWPFAIALTVAIILGVLSQFLKSDGVTVMVKGHLISVWVITALGTINMLLLAVLSLTKPIWIKFKFFDEDENKMNVF